MVDSGPKEGGQAMSMDQLAERFRSLKTIIAVLAAGLLVLAVVAAVAVLSEAMPVDESPGRILLMVLGLVAFGEAVGYIMIRQGLVRKTRTRLERCAAEVEQMAALANGFASLTIIGGAMLEGLGLFAAVIVLLTGQLVVLLAPALAIVFLLTLAFPTERKAREFIGAVTGQTP